MKRPTRVEELIDAVRVSAGTDCERHVELLENELRDVMLFGVPWHRVDGYGWDSTPFTQGWDQ